MSAAIELSRIASTRTLFGKLSDAEYVAFADSPNKVSDRNKVATRIRQQNLPNPVGNLFQYIAGIRSMQ